MVNDANVGAKTLDNGLRVLKAVAARRGDATAIELGRELGLDRTVTHRLLQTLLAHGLVVRSEPARYRLGAGAVELAGAARRDVRAAAAEPLRALAEATGATAHLTVLDGAEAVSVAVVEPAHATMHVAYRVGTRHPLDRGAAGLAILLGRPAERGERAQVRRARRRGWVASRGEIQPGAWGLAAPIWWPADGAVSASLGVVALQPMDEAEVAAHVVRAAADTAAVLAD